MTRIAARTSLSVSVPRNRGREGYDARRILDLAGWIASPVFEMTPYFGPSLVTAFARLDGYPVGVMAGDPYAIGGSLDTAASDKMVKFIDLCDTFHMPPIVISSISRAS